MWCFEVAGTVQCGVVWSSTVLCGVVRTAFGMLAAYCGGEICFDLPECATMKVEVAAKTCAFLLPGSASTLVPVCLAP